MGRELVKAHQVQGGLMGQKTIGGVAMMQKQSQARIVQRIITPEGKVEIEMVPNPASWYKGRFPTTVILEGQISSEALEWLIRTASLYGWKFCPEERKFFPMDEEE